MRAALQPRSKRVQLAIHQQQLAANPLVQARGSTTADLYVVYALLYHWSSAKFSSTWYDALSVLVAKGRAQVGVAASSGDWSKRIRDMQYTDHEDYTVGS